MENNLLNQFLFEMLKVQMLFEFQMEN